MAQDQTEYVENRVYLNTLSYIDSIFNKLRKRLDKIEAELGIVQSKSKAKAKAKPKVEKKPVAVVKKPGNMYRLPRMKRIVKKEAAE